MHGLRAPNYPLDMFSLAQTYYIDGTNLEEKDAAQEYESPPDVLTSKM